MARICRLLFVASWAAGLVGLVIAVILRVAQGLVMQSNLSPRSGLIFAGTMFLCALATHEMERSEPSKS